MAKTLQHRRGTTTELASVTGAIGEIFMDTTKNTLVVMDGTTPGGVPLAVEGSGGSGSSYDQSLNTTDNVVFDSALVGNVAIITNQVTGIDSYGNNDTLVLSGTEVNIGPAVPLVTTVATTYNNFGGAWVENASMYGVAGNAVIINGSGGSPLPTDMQNTVSTLAAGDTIFIQPNMFTGGTWTLTSGFTYNGAYSYWIATVAESTTLSSMGGTQQVTFTQASTSTQEASYVFAANGTLGVNQDLTILSTGNTTISANSTVVTTTPVTIDQMGAPALAWFYDTISGKSYFGFNSMSGDQYAQYFKAGMTVNCFRSAGGMKDTPLTLTLKTDMAYSNISAGSYLSETNEVAVNNGMSTYIYTASDISTTASSGSIANYTFDTTGAFTAQSLLATDALIGDVSIVGNTIAGVDSYGLADTLVVDGNLQVANTAASTTSYTNGSQWDGSINWFSGVLQWSYPSIGMSLMQSLKAGDKLTFEDQMNVGTFVTVTLTSAFAYNMGYMAYIASVAEFNSGMTIGAAAGTISIASLVTKTSTFNSTGLTVDGNLQVTGTLQLPVTPDTPVTPGTVVTWAKINIGGQVYFTPLYQ